MSQYQPECQEEADFYGERPTDSEPWKLLTKSEVQDLVSEAGKDCEDVFEYLNGLEVKFDDGTKMYKLENVKCYINR